MPSEMSISISNRNTSTNKFLSHNKNPTHYYPENKETREREHKLIKRKISKERIMWRLVVLLVMIEISEVGLSTLIKASSTKGMSNYVFVVYSNAFALLPLLLLTFFFYRNRPGRNQLKWSTVARIFMLSPLGTIGQICKYTGASLSNPTLYSAILDLTPAFAFIIAIITRMEVLELKVRSSQAKTIGTVIAITGALVVTLYKGMPIISPPIPVVPSLSTNLSLEEDHRLSSPSNWVLGGFLLGVTSFLTALFYIIQAWILRDYPEPLMVTVLSLFFHTIASTLFAIIVERDPGAWILRPDLELFTILYQVVLMLGIRDIVHAWAVGNKGPVFVSMFKPLQLVFAVIMGFVFLGEAICLGSVIGAAIIAAGFYAIMWGKAKEEKMLEDIQLPDNKVPLIQNTITSDV